MCLRKKTVGQCVKLIYLGRIETDDKLSPCKLCILKKYNVGGKLRVYCVPFQSLRLST